MAGKPQAPVPERRLAMPRPGAAPIGTGKLPGSGIAVKRPPGPLPKR